MKRHIEWIKTAVYVMAYLFVVITHAYADDKLPPGNAIASAHPLATEAGMKILKKGGNAFDAAVAVTAALAVVEPYSSGLGGGGFWLLHRAKDKLQIMVDGRERAPEKAHSKMYLDKNGDVIPGLSIDGPLAAGIPGTPAAIVHLTKKYGRLSLKENLDPAIRLARDGFPVDPHFQRMATFRQKALQASKAAAAVFLHKGKPPPVGHVIRQKDLAATLRSIARKGKAGFYDGRVAQVLVQGVQAAQGIWTLKDLQDYKVVERQPVVGMYRGIKIISAAPPSSGGIALVTMLNILASYPPQDPASSQNVHSVVEAMRRAYRDRAEYLGDPDFVSVPIKMLTHPMYAQGLRNSIHAQKATPSEQLPGPDKSSKHGQHTTHFSIMDREGNRVSATLSINYPFGSCFMPPRTGVILNDEMDDFVAKPLTANAYGLVGAEANAIAPGKRPLSSMTPTFLEGPDGVGILGTPGGSRIITMVLLGVLDYAAGNKPEHWVALPRFHHQYLPDRVQHEADTFNAKQIQELSSYGHSLQALERNYGNMQAILWDKRSKQLFAASDPRGLGKAVVQQ